MGSRKSSLVKRRLTKAFRANGTIPAWKRQQPDNKQDYNRARRNWRTVKLKIY